MLFGIEAVDAIFLDAKQSQTAAIFPKIAGRELQ
jgi:hypothetical protein